MERATGLEPATSSLGSLRSTTELCPHAASSRSQCNGEGQRGQGPCGAPDGPGGQSRAGGAAPPDRGCESDADRYTHCMNGSGKNREGANRSEYLYFFPDQKVTADELRQMLRQATSDQRAWVISHLLRYAQRHDIRAYVSRDEVKEIFPTIDLPENLRLAWARMLKIEAPVA